MTGTSRGGQSLVGSTRRGRRGHRPSPSVPLPTVISNDNAVSLPKVESLSISSAVPDGPIRAEALSCGHSYVTQMVKPDSMRTFSQFRASGNLLSLHWSPQT